MLVEYLLSSAHVLDQRLLEPKHVPIRSFRVRCPILTIPPYLSVAMLFLVIDSFLTFLIIRFSNTSFEH